MMVIRIYQKMLITTGWKKTYEVNPDAAAMNENHKRYLNFYNRNKNAQAEGSKEPVAKKTMPQLDMGGQTWI